MDDDERMPPDPGAAPYVPDEATWIAEIERRARAALFGSDRGSDADEALDRISRDLGL